MQASPVLDQEFLPLRAKLLEIAAALDRLDRDKELSAREPRLRQVRAAIEVLLENQANRAERLQLVFSREYEENWRAKFGLAGA